jgi:hypothetical protein
MKKNPRTFMVAAVLLAACSFTGTRASSSGRINLSQQFPTENQTTFIYVTDQSGKAVEGAEITVTYRPESRVEKTTVLGKTNRQGVVKWIPEDVGIVEITAVWKQDDGTSGETTRNVSVEFASRPKSGIFIMIFAGFLLLGGSAWRFIQLLRTPEQNDLV